MCESWPEDVHGEHLLTGGRAIPTQCYRIDIEVLELPWHMPCMRVAGVFFVNAVLNESYP